MNKNKKRIITNLVGLGAGLVATTYALKKADQYLDEEAKEERKKRLELLAVTNTMFSTLPKYTLKELEGEIATGKPIIAYLAWSENCQEARLFEMNTFDTYIDADVINLIYVVDLDKEIPEALKNRELREPYTKALKIDTWTADEIVNPMFLKSPQLIYYRDGEIKALITETEATFDSYSGLNEWYVQAFFDAVKTDLRMLNEEK